MAAATGNPGAKDDDKAQAGWLGRLGFKRLDAYTPVFTPVLAAELEHLCSRHRVRKLHLKARDDVRTVAAMAQPLEIATSAEEALRMSAPRRRAMPAATAAATGTAEDEKSDHPGLRATELSALALSGGGIRSAAFASGVMQAMAQAGKLECFDYLSTVSGGGYTGSALTWALYDQATKGANDLADLKVIRNTSQPNPFRPAPGDGKVTLLGHIRERASYLAPTQTLNLLTAIGNTLRLSISSLLIYAALALCFALPPTAIYVAGSGWLHDNCSWFGMATPQTAGAYALLVLSGLGFALLLVLPLLRQAWKRDFESTHAIRVAVLQDFSAWSAGLLLLALAATLPLSHDYIARQDIGAAITKLAGLAVAGGASGLLSLIERLDDRLRILLVRLAATILAYLAGLALYAVALWLVQIAMAIPFSTVASAYLGVAGLIVIACWRYNPNFISPHRFYRDRLMETFMPAADGQGYAAPDVANLSAMCGLDRPGPYRGPYHIVNTNVILNRSRQPRYYQRGGDSFMLSPLYSGSAATGWLKTAQQSKSNNHSLSLATAMAISAAAANPNTAGGEDGLMRRWSISFLMTLLNVRLGYWQPNPGKPVRPGGKGTSPPNFLRPGVMSLLSDYGREHESFVELSDGGHFDNTGLYELFRRRVRIIVLSDASCDPDFSLDDLGRALALAQIDFGIAAVFDPMPQADSRALWAELDPDPAQPNAYRGKGYPAISDGVRAKLLRDGFVTATLAYPGGETGRLIYLKPALVSDAPVDLLAYALDYPDFPHHSTSDQFFSERRFESYRRLGFFIAEKMMKAEFA